MPQLLDPANTITIVYGGTVACARVADKGMIPYYCTPEIIAAATLDEEGRKKLVNYTNKPEEMLTFLKDMSAKIPMNDAITESVDSIDFQLEVHTPKILKCMREQATKAPDKKMILFLFGTDTLDKYSRLIAANQELRDLLKANGQKLMICTSMESLSQDPSHVMDLLNGAYFLGLKQEAGSVFAITPKDKECSGFYLHDPLDETFRKCDPLNYNGLRSAGAAHYMGKENNYNLIQSSGEYKTLKAPELVHPPATPLCDGNSPEILTFYARGWREATLLIEGTPPKAEEAEAFYNTLDQNRLEAIFVNPQDYNHKTCKFNKRYNSEIWEAAKENAPKKNVRYLEGSRAADIFILTCPVSPEKQARPHPNSSASVPPYLALQYTPSSLFTRSIENITEGIQLLVNSLACRSASASIVPKQELKRLNGSGQSDALTSGTESFRPKNVTFFFEVGLTYDGLHDENERYKYEAATAVAELTNDGGYVAHAGAFVEKHFPKERAGGHEAIPVQKLPKSRTENQCSNDRTPPLNTSLDTKSSSTASASGHFLERLQKEQQLQSAQARSGEPTSNQSRNF